jgi:pimeloyl-ACP methyl ester carboxylesterase
MRVKDMVTKLKLIALMSAIVLLLLAFWLASNFANISMKAKMVRVGDIEVGYKEFGSGKPLVMIIGLGSTMDRWPSKVLNELSKHYRVIVFDNRGMGYTSAPPGNFSILQFANDTAGFMAALNMKSAYVLGCSMGTCVAQELVLNHPEKVEKLILYASYYGGPKSEGLNALMEANDSFLERISLLRLLIPPGWLLRHPRSLFNLPIPIEGRPSQANLERQKEAVKSWKGAYERLFMINKSTLILAGTDDVITPSKWSRVLARHIPGSQLIEVKEWGHVLMYQFPDNFSRIVIDFLESRG